MTEAPCVDATCSVDSSTSTGELHERLYAPFMLDRMLILGCRQLRSVLAESVDNYNGHRPHRALGQAPPLGPAEPPVVLTTHGRSYDDDRLDGLIHEYAQAA